MPIHHYQDRNTVGVAVPSISNQFDSFDQNILVRVRVSSHLFHLPTANGQNLCTSPSLSLDSLLMMTLAQQTFFSPKWTFIILIVIFEVGSVVCAAGPTSPAFIVGHAIAGIGSAGTFTGAMVIFVDLLPLQKRPKYMGFLGATFGLASIGGPLLGSLFTTEVTWRWCFWINLPTGGLAIMVLLFALPAKPPPKKHAGESFMQRIRQFVPVGMALLLHALVLLLLAQQWGWDGYAWGSTRVAVSLVLGQVLTEACGISQLWAGDNGIVPPWILGQRSIAAGAVVSLGFDSALIILTFYLPIWFQAIKGQSAFSAGFRLLPYFLGTVTFVIGSGFVVSKTKTGYNTPVLIAGTARMVVRCGLLTTLQVDTSNGEWIGYEVSIRSS